MYISILIQLVDFKWRECLYNIETLALTCILKLFKKFR